MITEDKLIWALNHLLEKTCDAEKRAQRAVKDVDDLPLQEVFKQRAPEKYDFGNILKKKLPVSLKSQCPKVCRGKLPVQYRKNETGPGTVQKSAVIHALMPGQGLSRPDIC